MLAEVVTSRWTIPFIDRLHLSKCTIFVKIQSSTGRSHIHLVKTVLWLEVPGWKENWRSSFTLPSPRLGCYTIINIHKVYKKDLYLIRFHKKLNMTRGPRTAAWWTLTKWQRIALCQSTLTQQTTRSRGHMLVLLQADLIRDVYAHSEARLLPTQHSWILQHAKGPRPYANLVIIAPCCGG